MDKVTEVIILGTGITSVQCPYDAEVWTVNSGYTIAKKMDRLFISDPKLDCQGQEWLNYKKIKKLKCPIVSLHKLKGIKTEMYPYDEIVKQFKTEFFTDSICYMIAYALYKGYNKIRMYGVDMATSLEYLLEKGGIEYWVGYARGVGVEVEISKGSFVCQTAMKVRYGDHPVVDLATADPENLLGWKGKDAKTLATYQSEQNKPASG